MLHPRRHLDHRIVHVFDWKMERIDIRKTRGGCVLSKMAEPTLDF